MLDVLLQTEPDANLARIFEILSTDLKSSKAIDFFSGTETLQMTFGVNENWKVDDIKETVFNDLMNEVSEFLKKNSSHSDPFLIWLRQYHQTANQEDFAIAERCQHDLGAASMDKKLIQSKKPCYVVIKSIYETRVRRLLSFTKNYY